METNVAERNGVESAWHELVELVNQQFETPPFRRLLGISFSNERAQALSIQMKHYVANRRDCWGFVAGASPLSVKRLIWEHEGEELMGDKAAGKVDHITLAVQEGRIFGLSPEDYERVRPLDSAMACFYAWIHLAKDRPWREAIAASSVLEMRNSDDLVRGGSLSYRVGKNLERDLGIPLRQPDQQRRARHRRRGARATPAGGGAGTLPNGRRAAGAAPGRPGKPHDRPRLP